MVKAKDKSGTPNDTSESLKDKAKEALGKGRSDFVWVRDDGAVCFGDECVVLKPAENDTLDLQVKPDRCGREAGPVILEHIIKTAGKGVNIIIPPIDESK